MCAVAIVTRSCRALALGLLVAGISPIAFAERAGEVIFAAGSVSATDPQGAGRALDKGAAVEEGDTIVVEDGRVQIHFKDGAFLALHAHTRFRIDRYRYAAAGDSEDGVLLSLLKGGLRTISGVVGKTNRSAYSLDASVATIGIRGTDYALQLNDELIGKVGEGAIEVCNSAGCLNVQAGQAFLVRSLTEMPILSDRHVFLPPTQPVAREKHQNARTLRGGDREHAGPRNAIGSEHKIGGAHPKDASPPGTAGLGHGGHANAANDLSVPAPPSGPSTSIGAQGRLGNAGVEPGKDVINRGRDTSGMPGQLTNPGAGLGPPGGEPPGQLKR